MERIRAEERKRQSRRILRRMERRRNEVEKGENDDNDLIYVEEII
jgi:hypothetical protein